MTVTITSIAGGAPKPVFDRLGPLFERRTGNKLNALYDTMSGIAGRVAAHEAFDVLVMPVPLIEAYVKDGTVMAAGRAALANIGLGVGVKAGGDVPDVSTPDKLRAALLAARMVVHAPPTATPSGAQSDKIIKELGLERALAGRVVHRAGLAGGITMIALGIDVIGIFPKERNRRRAGRCARGRTARRPAAQYHLWGRGRCREPGTGRGGGIHQVSDRAGEPPSLDRLRLRSAGELGRLFVNRVEVPFDTGRPATLRPKGPVLAC